MSRSFRIAYFAHSLRSDWNNGNAHFLRGLLDHLRQLGHAVTAFEPANGWSLQNLRHEPKGKASLRQFNRFYPKLNIIEYKDTEAATPEPWRERLRDLDFVIVHEWNPPELTRTLLSLRDGLGFKLLFHDTHHRASSSPESIQALGVDRFDGILAFGEALRSIYHDRFGLDQVWTLHEAADADIFEPLNGHRNVQDLVWIGNWGDDERTAEIREFLLEPAQRLPEYKFTIYGVRYPESGLQALQEAGVRYGGYLPNLTAPDVYAESDLTVHIPRRQYVEGMRGIPTIRVFEALSCAIPLLSAPWEDTEKLFKPGDIRFVHNGREMRAALRHWMEDEDAALDFALSGQETVLDRHTCRHRAEQLSTILEDLLR